MRKQELCITIVDHRRGGEVRAKHYTNHKSYLRDMSKLSKLSDVMMSETTETTVHIHPPSEAVELDLFGGGS